MKPDRYILVADDEEPIRAQACRVLTAAGYTVIAVANGTQALARLRCEDPPDLVLLDNLMSPVDGIEVRTQQLADPSLRTIPTVLLTCRSARSPDPLVPDDLLTGGLPWNGWLTKPFTDEALIGCVLLQRNETRVRPVVGSLSVRRTGCGSP